MKKLLFVAAASTWRLYDEIIKMEPEKYGHVKIAGFLDDDPNKQKSGFDGLPVLGAVSELTIHVERNGITSVAILFGPRTMALREEAYWKARSMGLEMPTLIHPTSILARHIDVGEGSMIGIGVIISQNALVKNNCCILAGATVGHDNIIEDHVFIASGAILQGNVRIHKKTFIGPGAIITDAAEVGEGSIIGAGSVVLKDVPSNVFVCGSPAKVVRSLTAEN
jgi:acetyltransferase EpsM